MCVCVCVCARVCVRVCVMCVYMSIYMYMCIYIYIEREREREGEREREREREISFLSKVLFMLVFTVPVELHNSQVMMKGIETSGFVIISAARARIISYIHMPIWHASQLRSKSTWTANVDCMQVWGEFSQLLLDVWRIPAGVARYFEDTSLCCKVC